MALLISARACALDWRRTIAYVDQNGNEVERARLRGILGRPRPDAKVMRTLEARQNEDGGFPHGFVQGRLSTIDATVTAMGWMQDLGLVHGACVERAGMFLLASQRPDGSWDEPPGLIRYGPPPRLLPGDPRVRVVTTALAGYRLARAGYRDDVIARSAQYLRLHQATGGRFMGFLRATWLATAFFGLVEGRGSESAARGLEALAAVEPDRWCPGTLTGMLAALGETGVSEEAPVVAAGFARLCALAQSDGSWVSEDGDLYHVEVTLQGLRVLLLYAAVSSPPG